MEREYDIIVWGASGFTGRLVVDYMAQQQSASNLKWAVAGRNPEKIRSVLGNRDIPIVQADSNDSESIAQLVQQTRVVLTTVGPYARYGSSLVEACAAHGTHYCDLTGEVHWMREMISAHQAAAVASGGSSVVAICHHVIFLLPRARVANATNDIRAARPLRRAPAGHARRGDGGTAVEFG